MKTKVFGSMDEVVRIAYEGDQCEIDIICNGKIHTLTLSNNQITVNENHHAPDEVEQEEVLSGLAGDEPKIPCVRVKKYLKEWLDRGYLAL